MQYPYPRISNYLIYRKRRGGGVCVTDYQTDARYLVEGETAQYMRRLDGFTHPFDIPTTLTKGDVKQLLAWLKVNDLLRESDVASVEGGYFLKMLWQPRVTPALRWFARLLNLIFTLGWLPLLVWGFTLFCRNFMSLELGGGWFGLALGMVFGIVLHEYGHACAALANKAPVFEMGVMLMHYVLPGAYVIFDDSSLSVMQRVQVLAAGVQTNLLLTGACFWGAAVWPMLSADLFMAATANLVLAAGNLLLIKGFDGMGILSNLLGEKDLVQASFAVVFNKKKRQAALKSGVSGVSKVAVGAAVCALQLLLPLLLLMNVLEGVACFV